MTGLIQKIKHNYHWVIFLVVFLQGVIFGGIVNNTSIYVIPVTESLNISRSLFSSLNIFNYVGSTLSMMLSVRLFHKFGYRTNAFAAMGSLVAACLLTAISKDPFTFALGRLLQGFSYGACATAGEAWIIRAWFHKHYGTVLGLVTMSTGVGGMLLSVFLTKIMELSDWRWSMVAAAGMVTLCAVLYIFVRNTPEELGQKPYGEGRRLPEKHKRERLSRIWPGLSVAETKRHPAYWLMCAFLFLSCFNIYLSFGVVVPHFQDFGYSAMEAAKYQSILMLGLAVAKFLCGWISEKIGGKALAILCMVCAIIGQWCLADVTNPVFSYVVMAVYSVSICLTSVAIPLVCEPIFGVESSTNLMGFFLSMATIAGAVSGPVCNFFYDAFGSYSPVFRIASILDVVWLGMLIVVILWFGKKEKQWVLERKA